MPDTPIVLQPVDVGAAPNNGEGDQLRPGGIKINTNDATLKTHVERVLDVLGVDSDATTILGSDVAALITSLQSAASVDIQLRPVWMANDTAEATLDSEDSQYTSGDLSITSGVCIIRGNALTSTGEVSLRVYRQSDGANYLSGDTVSLKSYSGDSVNTLTLVGSPPALDAGDSIIARVRTAEDDVAGGEVEVYMLAAPA